MNDFESFTLDECPSCSMALDSLSDEEGLCYRCAVALHDVSAAIEAFSCEPARFCCDEEPIYVM